MPALSETQDCIMKYCVRNVFRTKDMLSPVLLTGGRGTGKRTIARTMAYEVGVPFIEIPLAGSGESIRERLFGSRSEGVRARDSQEPPGELSSLDNCLVYFSELQNLPDEMHHDFHRLVTRRRYSDLGGCQWQLPPGLIIVVGLSEGDQAVVTVTHWLCRQFDVQFEVNVPRNEEEILYIVKEIIREIQSDCDVVISKNEATVLMKAAQWNIRTLREWIQHSMITRLNSKQLNYENVRVVLELHAEYLLSRMLYCGSAVPLDRYLDWAAQFPKALAAVPIQILRRIHDTYYIGAAEFQYGILSLIRASGIRPRGKVVFCKWQLLGKSGPVVTNELKNKGQWKLLSELDIDHDSERWPTLADGGRGVNFVLADDFVGSGRTLRMLFKRGDDKIRKLIEYYPEGTIKVLLLVGYDEPLAEIRRIARNISNRIHFHVYRLFGSKDRCFTNDSLIFPAEDERNRVMEFCREVAAKYFSAFFQTHPFGFGDVASLCVFYNTVPNDSMPILWFDEAPQRWTPLFPAKGLVGKE